jgi:hypothetical protein
MTISTDVRTLVGYEVAVETTTGVVRGTLLSCTARSLWIVAGEDDFVVPMTRVQSVHTPTPVG